jgi:hypothetical protein
MTNTARPPLVFKAVFSLLLLLILPAMALADDKSAPAAPGQDEATKAWIAYGAPGEAHKALAELAGTWDVKNKFWMAPGAPPMESTGKSEIKMILGGRYLEQHYEGTMMGGPFSGVGVTGFDNYKKRVVATWIDSMGTGIMETSGSFDKSHKVLTAWGTMDDPVAKKTNKVKTVVTIVDADHFTYASWHPGADGKLTQDLEVSYSRKK